MNLARTIDDYLDALAHARLGLSSPTVLLPFFAFALLQCAAITMLAFWSAPPLGSFMPPVVALLGGDASLHYPTHFVLLPGAYRRLYLPLVATVGFAAWSLAVWTMVAHHEVGERAGARSFRRALPAIVVIGVVFVVVTVAIGRGLGLVTAKLPGGLVGRAGTLGVIAVTAAAQALLVYAPVVLRLRGGGPRRALVASARFALANFGATAMLIATVLVVHLPLDGLIANADGIAGRFHPEAIYQLMIASVVLEMVTAYVLFAGVAGLALREERGLR